MLKSNKSGKKNAPSSLLHFTSVDSFFKMMEPSLNHPEKARFITFHASHYAQMNDKNEGKIIANRFYHSQHKAYSAWEEHKGSAFVLSFIASRRKRMEYNIPMWLNYGCQGKGLCLRFDTKDIKAFARPSLEFESCDYLSSDDVAEKIKHLQEIERTISKDDFQREVAKTVHFSKDEYWQYEEEYRIIKFEQRKNVMQKITPRGIIEYVTLEIPLTALRGICIGPLTDHGKIKGSLETLLEHRLQHNGVTISLSPLHLQ